MQKRWVPNGATSEGALKGTIFALKIARKQQSLFGQKCEPDSARLARRAVSDGVVSASKKKRAPLRCSFLFGGATRNRTGDRGVADLCLTAWPWRHIFNALIV